METENVEALDFVDSSFFTGDKQDGQTQEPMNMQESFSPKLIGSIAKYVEPVNGNNPIDILIEQFQKDPNLTVVPVEEYDHVVGVIDRKTVMAATNTAWKRFTAKNITDYTQKVPTLLYAHDFIEKALQKVSDINRDYGIFYFPVFNNKSFYGIVSLDAFLSRIAEIREQDLQKASVIQASLMTNKKTLESLPYKVTAWNRMANALGGDFYQVYSFDDKRSVVCCFDVSGKNVAASLLTIAVGSFFKTITTMAIHPETPAQLIASLDSYLAEVIPSGNFITAAFLYIDLERKVFSFFNCGHTTTYVLFKQNASDVEGKVAELKPELPPLGMGLVRDNLNNRDKPYPVIALKPGIHIDMYSDGFTDMKNDDEIRYEDANAKKFFINLYNTDSSQIEDTITHTVDTYIQHAMIPDDITVIDIRI